MDYASILTAGQQLVPDLRAQLMQNAVFEQQQNEAQLRERALQQQIMQAEQAQREKAEFEAARDEALIAGTPQAILALQARFPEMSKPMKEVFDRLDERQRQNALTTLGTIYARGQQGDWSGAMAALRERVEADRAAGFPDPRDEALLQSMDSPNPVDRKVALQTIGIMMASVNPDKFNEVYGQLNPTPIAVQREYEWRVGKDGKEAADRWLATQDESLVAVEPGGSIYRKSDFVQPEGGDPSGSQAGEPASVYSYNLYRRTKGEAAANEYARRTVFQVASPEVARMLPSGTRIILPDGSPGVVP